MIIRGKEVVVKKLKEQGIVLIWLDLGFKLQDVEKQKAFLSNLDVERKEVREVRRKRDLTTKTQGSVSNVVRKRRSI